jgi:hypothetical protein
MSMAHLEAGLNPKTRTDHRLGENYLKNHPWMRKG